MRDDELGEVDPAIAIQEQVEVERSRAVRRAGPQPPRRGFQAPEQPEQIEGRQDGPAGGDGVQEVGLAWPAHGSGDVERRKGEPFDVRSEARESGGEGKLRRPDIPA